MHNHYPQRIVCAAAEAPEILAALGAFDCIIGVSSFTKQPTAALNLPRIGGFSTPDVQRVLKLNPDLVITISDIQAQFAASLISEGIPVLALNPHSLVDVWRSILWIGGIIGRQARAQEVVAELKRNLDDITTISPLVPPRVYFEEWHDPPITGIGWVSDLIEVVGGQDIFADRKQQPLAKNRIISFQDVATRQPDIIVASWCGKPADLDTIRQRPAFSALPAVLNDQVYEITSDYLLQVGPSLLKGAQQLHQIIHRYTDGE